MPNASWRRWGVASARGGGSPTLGAERERRGKGEAQRRAAQAQRGSLGKPLAGARGEAPLRARREGRCGEGTAPAEVGGGGRAVAAGVREDTSSLHETLALGPG